MQSQEDCDDGDQVGGGDDDDGDDIVGDDGEGDVAHSCTRFPCYLGMEI